MTLYLTAGIYTLLWVPKVEGLTFSAWLQPLSRLLRSAEGRRVVSSLGLTLLRCP